MSSAPASRIGLRPRRWLRWLAELLVLFAVLLAVEAWLTRDAVQGRAPLLPDLPAITERAHMVYFWGTWCPVCRTQQSTINAVARTYPLYSVAMQSGSRKEVEAYLAAHGLQWPTQNDEQGVVAGQWGVRGVPAVFIIDRHGRIRFVTRGYSTPWGLRLRLWWADTFARQYPQDGPSGFGPAHTGQEDFTDQQGFSLQVEQGAAAPDFRRWPGRIHAGKVVEFLAGQQAGDFQLATMQVAILKQYAAQ